jgi:phosphocarrier protein NPr
MPDSQILQHNCKIVNKYGLHTRSAAAIVALANQYQCTITLSSEKGDSDARDMIRLMLLEASKGSSICIKAEGENAANAILAMTNLIESGFYEQED